MEKKCTKCGEVKSLDAFYNNKNGKHGKMSRCKDCDKLYYQDNRERQLENAKEYRENNKEKIAKYSKAYRENNKEAISEYKLKYNVENKKYLQDYHSSYRQINKNKIKKYQKEYRSNNKEELKKKRKEYYDENRDKCLEISKKYVNENKNKIKKYKKEYREENRDKIKKYQKKYRAQNKDQKNIYLTNRRKLDCKYKLTITIRNLIHGSLKIKGYTKKTKTFNILKCEYDFFMKWLNGVASNGYTYGVGDLHLDHVVPVSLGQTEDEILLLNHYSNLQLLSADENQKKYNSYVNRLNLARVLEHHPNPDKIREIYTRLKN